MVLELAGRMLKKGNLPNKDAMLTILWKQLEVLVYAIKALEARTSADPFFSADQEEQILQAVESSWEKRGEGPLWSELAERFGWTPTQRNRFIHYLAARALVTFTVKPLSLRTVRQTD